MGIKNRKHAVFSAIIIASFIGLISYTVIIQSKLNDYRSGFYLKGTYQSVEGTLENKEYLTFFSKEDSENVFHHYKQLGFIKKGSCKSTSNANLYYLNIEDSSINDSYMLVYEDKINIFKNKTILEYEKISNHVLFINQK